MNRLLSLSATLPIVLGALSLGGKSEHSPDVSAPAPQVEQPKPNRGQQSPESSEVTLYDPDPNHLWNRLHRALHVRDTDMSNPEKEQALFPGDQSYHALELDAFLWHGRSTYLRFGQPHKTALAVLDEFLAKGGEK